MTMDVRNVGARLRAERHRRGWTLEELAARTHMSVSTLSRLESGKRQASLELLVPLTEELGVRIDDLLTREVRDPRVHRDVIHRDGLVIVALTPPGAPFDTFKITYPQLAANPPRHVHDGYEWLYVIRGRLRIVLDDQEFVFAPGEAAEFDTGIPHAIGSARAQPAQAICILNNGGTRAHVHSHTPNE